MPLNLPPPSENVLGSAPVALVICQVRFEELVGEQTSRRLLAIYQDLGAEESPYPVVEQSFNQTLNLQVGDAGVQALGPQSQSGWRLSSRDGTWNAYLMPNHVTLETTEYTSWREEFRERFAALLAAASRELDPQLEQRLGLRYVNRITEPQVSSPSEWRGYIADEFLGPLLHPGIGPGITAAQQQLDLDAGDTTRGIVRHGFFADQARGGELTYLLDFDVHRQGTRRFDQAQIMNQLDEFNLLALQIFQASISPAMLEVLNAERSHAS